MNGDDMPVPIVPTVIAMLELAGWITKQVERHQRGEMTDDELRTAYAQMKVKVDAANDLWVNA